MVINVWPMTEQSTPGSSYTAAVTWTAPLSEWLPDDDVVAAGSNRLTDGGTQRVGDNVGAGRQIVMQCQRFRAVQHYPHERVRDRLGTGFRAEPASRMQPACST
ncbi:hypothetical protein B0293_25555 [Amycolatopsis azurea DSM 43854]|uniref:Uncharacterized protein n=1 Tax=Amycolatopsis azurea DSM 43854 TaxID=1238180 RepID=A0ABX3J8M4_9PSEU|nr:hypothetical protein B0293_25555 [Amycolatopsis azurea DSM 43854]